MDLIVLAKYVPDITRVPDDAWDRERGTLRRQRLKMAFNPLDRVALRTALRVCDLSPGARITVITMGPPVAARMLREAAAHGADQLVLLTDRAFAGADTLATAYTLTTAIRHLAATGRVADDFILLCGMQSPDGDTAQVPAQLASLLDVPLYPYVTDVLPAAAPSACGTAGLARPCHTEGEPSGLRFRCLNPVGFQVVTPLARPYVVTVTRLAEDLPAYVSLEGILRANETAILTLDAAAIGADPSRIGLEGSRTRVVRIYAPERRGEKAEALVAAHPDFRQRVPGLLRRLRAAFAETSTRCATGCVQPVPSTHGLPATRVTPHGRTKSSQTVPAGTHEAGPGTHARAESYYRGDCLGLCETIEGRLTAASFEVISRCADLARRLGAACGAIILGEADEAMAEALRRVGASRLYALATDDPSPSEIGGQHAGFAAGTRGQPSYAVPRFRTGEGAFRVRERALALAAFLQQHRPQIVVLPATLTGRVVAPYVAARLDCGLTADCSDLEVGDFEAFDREAGRSVTYARVLHQIRPALGGNIMARIVSIYRDCTRHRPQMATARPGALPLVEQPAERCQVVDVSPAPRSGERGTHGRTKPAAAHFLPLPSRETQAGTGRGEALYQVEPRPEGEQEIDLQDFEAIVAVGMGVRDRATIDRLVIPFAEQLGRFLGAEVGLGCSRAVVDAGLLPHRHQVGQTGIVVKPKLYVALGVSGAIQHRIGMEGARTVLAINRDPDAPMHGLARFSIVGEIEQVLPALQAALSGEGEISAQRHTGC